MRSSFVTETEEGNECTHPVVTSTTASASIYSLLFFVEIIVNTSQIIQSLVSTVVKYSLSLMLFCYSFDILYL